MKSFRVIVVGGGPTGLLAAHALSLAGIDFIVLERRPELVEDVGASLVLGPSALRVFHQIGLLERLMKRGAPVGRQSFYTPEGILYNFFFGGEMLKANHGTAPVMFHRADILYELYNALSAADQARILTTKTVVEVQSNEEGVTVKCADGSVHAGSIVLGADGVHSVIQQQIKSQSLEAAKSDPQALKAEYKVMWCSLPRLKEFGVGSWNEVHGPNVMAQCFTNQDKSWLFVYERLPAPTTERARYTQSDIEEYASKWADLSVTNLFTVKDIFSQRYKAGITHVEEGVIETWFHGRMVLAGDTVHKVSPHTGLGYQMGVQDVVFLVNLLQRKLASKETLNQAELTEIFTAYQADRKEKVQDTAKESHMMLRMSTWRGYLFWFFDRYALPFLPFILSMRLNGKVAGLISKEHILDFVDGKEPFEGRVPWVNRIGAKRLSQ